MAMREESKRWFDEALWDLETAKILHKNARYNAHAFTPNKRLKKR